MAKAQTTKTEKVGKEWNVKLRILTFTNMSRSEIRDLSVKAMMGEAGDLSKQIRAVRALDADLP